MPVTNEITSDYSGSLTPTSSAEESEEEEEIVRSRKVSDSSSLLWSGTGNKRCPLIIFRSESLNTRDKKLKAIGEKYHLAYKMVKTESKLVRSILTTYGFHEVHPNSADFNLMWTGAHLKPFSLRSLQDFQKVNHFPRSYEITRKDRLYKNIDRMAHTKGVKHFDFMPKSYIMPSEYQEFCAAYVKDKGPWIVKPIASSRGRGIYLINNPNQVPLEDNIMVCKYISNPLLIDGFKFDVRVYIAVTSYDPLLIYLFEEGLTRFATVKYEKTNKQLKNQMMHLTNYSINKKSHDYVRCEDPEVEDYGNKWSMSAMLRYLKLEGIDTSALMLRIEDVIIKSIISAELPVATACRMFVPHRENCIELYGLDILIDENLKPWLLEGNLSPSLACDAPIDYKIKSNMVSDFFSLAGFQCVDPMTRKQKKDPLRRPFSAKIQNDGSGLSGPTNKRPVSASGSKNVGSTNSSLTSEEAKVLKIAKEQYQRRGGFIRIFPTPETWELYGSFLEYKSNLNHMLAQKLFPDRVKSTVNGAYSSAVARMRHITSGKTMEGRMRVMSERFLQYERKLLSVDSRKRKPNYDNKKKKKKTPIGVDNRTVSQGHLRKVEDESDASEVDDASELSGISNDVKNAAGDKRPVSRMSSTSRPQSRLSNQQTQKKNKNPPTTSQSSIGDAKPRSIAQKSKTDVSKSGKDDLAGVRKVTQRIYTYKANSPSKTYTSTTAVKKQTQSQRPQPQDSSSNDSSSSESETDDQKKSSSRSTKTTTPQTKVKEPVNVLHVLKTGGNLGKVQARLAFSAYLSRVQMRLMTESESNVQEINETAGKQEEQMDLVLRFLKRAAGNLRQAFSVVVPSRRLTLPDRKRILAKQLGDFVHIYNKETDGMEQKSALGLEKDSSLLQSHRLPGSGTIAVHSNLVKDGDFRTFVSNATETELEEVLTTYTHKNKSASVFLGASKPRNREKPAPLTNHDTLNTNRLHNARMHQPVLMHNSHLYQSEEHREVPFEVPPQQQRSQQLSTLRVRSPSPNPSVASNQSHAGSTNSSAQPVQTAYHPPPLSSLPHAAYIYSAKLTPPSSVSAAVAIDQQKRPSTARGFNTISSNSTTAINQQIIGRPGSASSHALGGSLHYQTAANEEAIADALQRLAERQAARQYSATSQLQALTQHLSNLNLANMSSSRQHINTTGGGVQIFKQRTSSMTDLSNIENNFSNGNEPTWNHEKSNQSNSQFKSNPALAQQSKDLLRESKAKHQAMVEQLLDLWSSDCNENYQIAPHTRNYLCPAPSGETDHENCRQIAKVEKNNSLLDALIQEADEILQPKLEQQKYYMYVDKDKAEKVTLKNQRQVSTSTEAVNISNVLDRVLNDTEDPVEAYNKCAKLHNQSPNIWGSTESLLTYSSAKSKKRPPSRAEKVWKTYHNVSNYKSKVKQNKSPRRKKSQDKLCANQASDAYKIAKNWGRGCDGDHLQTQLSQIRNLFENNQLSCKRWRYQIAGSSYRPWSAFNTEDVSVTKSKQAHNIVSSINKTATTEKQSTDTSRHRPLSATDTMHKLNRPSSASMLHKGPSLSPPTSVVSVKTNLSGTRPPQVPRPPDAPKPPPTIRKPLGQTSTKVARTGSHPQLNGLSPNPAAKNLDEKPANFYSSLKYDTSTCATKITDFDVIPANFQRNVSRPSSASQQQKWKP